MSYGPFLFYNFTALEQNVARVASEDDVVYAIALDAEGRVAAHSGHPEWVGDLLAGDVDRAAVSAPGPITQHTVNRREEAIYGFAAPVFVNGARWGTVRVGLSKHRMEAQIRRTRLELAGLTIVTMLAAACAAAVIARRISKPVQQLAEGAAALARGEWNQRIEPTTDDEIGRLATAFNHMVAELAQQRVDLEDANTELRHGFEQLADLKTYTDNILASLTSGIVTVDLDGRVVTLNPAAELMTGFFVGEVRGRYCTEVFAHTPDLAELLMETLANRVLVAGVRVTLRRRNGRVVPGELELYGDRLEAQSVRVTRDWRREVPAVWADQEALYRALVNLVTNALDAMPRGGSLALRVGWSEGELLGGPRAGGRRVAIEVEDSGMGIAAADLDRVFNPFFSTKEGGTGLGLALTQKIVEDHGGSIDVRSVPGAGALFRIVLPLMPDVALDTGHDDRLG